MGVLQFKCMFHDEPVGECPPVKELERLRKENRELREALRAAGLADAEERALREAPLREAGEAQK